MMYNIFDLDHSLSWWLQRNNSISYRESHAEIIESM